MKNKILYIPLTSMTEPLGRSQVLEYLIDLDNIDKHLIDMNYVYNVEDR